MATFYERYLGGEDGRSIYFEIYKLRQEAFDERYYDDVCNVLTETFKRVRFNLEIIYSELKAIGYAFNPAARSGSEKPLLHPLSNAEKLLAKLDRAVSDFGYVPLSLKLFYKIVGSCNFAWDYEHYPEIRWEYADPIQIDSLDDVVSAVSEEDWEEYLTDILDDDGGIWPHVDLAADYLHKDNISGGPAYAIQLTEEPSIDGLFLNEANETTFINYLRICMEHCGFPGLANDESPNDYQAFFARVKPQLKSI